jgi:putative MATE family efflux protein
MSYANDIEAGLKVISQALRGESYDYTKGSIRKAVWLLAIPMVLEMCLESVFAVVDIYFVNRLGSEAVSIVGLTEAAITLIYSLGIGLSAGATALVARRIGEKDPEGAAKAAMQSLLIAGVTIFFISIAGWYFAEDILRVLHAEEHAIAAGVGYTRIMLGGSSVIVFLFLLNGIFRGAGDAAVAMRSLWLANGINIILCPLLINGWFGFPAMGIEGAAVATVVGRGIGVLYQLWKLFGTKTELSAIRKLVWWPDIKVIRGIMDIALPATIQFVIMSGSWIVLTRIVAGYGSEASSGYQTAIRLFIFFIMPAWGISNAAATLVGQNLGAGHPERAELSVRKIAKYNAIFMALVTCIFLLFARPLLAIFITDLNGLAFEYAVQALQIISAGYVLYGIGMVFMQAFNGAGDTRTPTRISILAFWCFQIPLAYVLSTYLKMGPLGVFIAIPVAEIFSTILYWIAFRRGNWKNTKV